MQPKMMPWEHRDVSALLNLWLPVVQPLSLTSLLSPLIATPESPGLRKFPSGTGGMPHGRLAFAFAAL